MLTKAQANAMLRGPHVLVGAGPNDEPWITNTHVAFPSRRFHDSLPTEEGKWNRKGSVWTKEEEIEGPRIAKLIPDDMTDHSIASPVSAIDDVAVSISKAGKPIVDRIGINYRDKEGDDQTVWINPTYLPLVRLQNTVLNILTPLKPIVVTFGELPIALIMPIRVS